MPTSKMALVAHTLTTCQRNQGGAVEASLSASKEKFLNVSMGEGGREAEPDLWI